jgi:hypothetical protein
LAGDCYPGAAPETIIKHVPEWIFCPKDRILETVAEWLVGMVLTGVEVVVGFVLSYFGIVRDALGTAGGDVWSAGVDAATAIQGALFALNSTVVDLGANSGLAGPVLSVGVFMLVVVVTTALLGALVALIRRIRIWVV